MFTGEATSTNKQETPLALEKDAVITDKKNMMFSGTLVSKGKGLGCVTGTGMKTEMGKIQ